MRKTILALIAACLYYSGLVGLARWWRQRTGPHLVILNYHRASGGDLRRHLLYLRRHYRLLPLEAALDELYGQPANHSSGRACPCHATACPCHATTCPCHATTCPCHATTRRLGKPMHPSHSSRSPIYRGTRACPCHATACPCHATTCPCHADGRMPLVLTFDDGYHDNYTHALPLAHELQVPITLFLIPGYIQSGDSFWWEEGKRLVQYAQEQEATIKGRIYHLNHPEGRKTLARAIEAEAFYASSVAEREAFLVSVRKALAVSSTIVPEGDPTSPLTWGQVCKMQESGWVSFGAHTMFHPILAYLTDPAEVRREVEECRSVLEQQLEHPVRVFAYPVGQFQHIGKNVRCAVQEAGYDWAVTTMYGFNTSGSDPYLLRRVEVDVTQHWLVVAAETAGLWSFFARLRWLPLVRKHLPD